MNLKKIKDSQEKYSGAVVIGPGEVLDTEKSVFNSNLTSIDMSKSSMEEIPAHAFKGCDNLKSVVLPKNVKTIGTEAFQECDKLKSIKFPESLESIGSYAFWYCTNLKIGKLPKNLKKIGADAFEHCSGITEINIPKSVTSIRYHAFANCANLSKVTVNSSEIEVDDEAFKGSKKLKYIFTPDGKKTVKDFLHFGENEDEDKLTDPDDIRTYASGLGEVALEELLGYMSGDTSFLEEALEDGISLTDFKDDILDNVSDKDIVEWYNDFRQ